MKRISPLESSKGANTTPNATGAGASGSASTGAGGGAGASADGAEASSNASARTSPGASVGGTDPSAHADAGCAGASGTGADDAPEHAESTLNSETPLDEEPNETYAFISHESAVEAIWALAARNWQGVLDNENVWLVPRPHMCITSQGDFKRLAKDVDLASLGIRKRPTDVLVPNKSCYSRGKLARFHVWSDFFPINSFVRVHDRVFVSTPYFTVIQLALGRRANRMQKQTAQQSAEEDARIRSELGISGPATTTTDLLRWENISRFVRATQVLTDFMGTYRYTPDGELGERPRIAYGMQPIITPEAFADYLAKLGSSRGIERARAVAAAAFAGSASPMETALALVLTLPKRMGGFGLPKPHLNWEIPIAPGSRDLVSQDAIFPDISWPDKQLAIEYYGWDEHFGAGPRKVATDMARANSLAALGWTVLHVSFDQMKTLDGISLIARQVAHMLGVSLPAPSELEMIWRARLIAQLLPHDERTLGQSAPEEAGV